MAEPAVKKGTKVTCENGHVIGECIEDVYSGDMAWGRKLGNWTQTPPKEGQPGPINCEVCGGPWFKTVTLGQWGNSIHFEDGWR